MYSFYEFIFDPVADDFSFVRIRWMRYAEFPRMMEIKKRIEKWDFLTETIVQVERLIYKYKVILSHHMERDRRLWKKSSQTKYEWLKL